MTVRDLVVLGTASQQPTRFRNHGAYLFRWLNEGMLFDPGEGTQRQFIFAEVAPTIITRIFISHFHGDHCLGLGSILMRLNLDNIKTKIKCYYPASGAKYFKRLKNATICKLNIEIEEIPIKSDGIVDDSGDFIIEAAFLDHGIDCLGWRISEKPVRKFDREKIDEYKLNGREINAIVKGGIAERGDKSICIEDISKMVNGDTIAVTLDTRPCSNVYKLAKNASLFLCESTYTSDEKKMAKQNKHMTSEDAANIAKKSNVQKLVLTHFSARYIKERVFQEDARKIFKNTIAARDLMRIGIPKSR